MLDIFTNINLGTGKSYSVLEVINAFEIASGKKIPYKIIGRREGDIDEIIKSLDEEWHHVVISAREISGNDLVKLRNEVQSAQARGGFNFSTILEEIDKYKIVSE